MNGVTEGESQGRVFILLGQVFKSQELYFPVFYLWNRHKKFLPLTVFLSFRSHSKIFHIFLPHGCTVSNIHAVKMGSYGFSDNSLKSAKSLLYLCTITTSPRY